jgi:hypothetical protein
LGLNLNMLIMAIEVLKLCMFNLDQAQWAWEILNQFGLPLDLHTWVQCWSLLMKNLGKLCIWI